MKKKSKKKRNLKSHLKIPQPHDSLKALKALSREAVKFFNTSTKVHQDKKKYSRKQKHKKNLSRDEE